MCHCLGGIVFPLARGLLSLEYRTSNSQLECFSFVVRRRLFLDLWALQSQEGLPHYAPSGSCGLSGGIQPQASSEGADRINTWREWTLLLPVTPASASWGLNPTGGQRARGALDRSPSEVSRGVWEINVEDWMQRNQHIY